LAEQVGPQGLVVATDINPRFLTELQLPNVEVRQHDIRTDPLEPHTYDLAHCRGVLAHLREPHLAVRRIVEALRIGGWLLIEEGDLSSLRAVDDHHPLAESFNRQNRELVARITQTKLFAPAFGPRVRSLLEEAGLSEIDNEGVQRVARGGETHARQYSMSLRVLMARGVLSQAECAALQGAYSDPSFSFITRSTFAAWGKRAG
jgi:SAM-dependent methyltransferase